MEIGAETLIVVTGALGNIFPKTEKPKTAVYSRKIKRKTEVYGSRSEIQTFVVDTTIAVSTERIVLKEVRRLQWEFSSYISNQKSLM